MRVAQSKFIEAVCNPDKPVPDGITSRASKNAKRFAVYRNNVISGLTEALERAFPVIRKLVGDEFFKAMAGNFVREFPPNSPLMMRFATEFPEFLESFEPVQSLPYLADVARLEIALRESYHAEDSSPISQEAFAAVPADKLVDARIELAPSIRLLGSESPIFSIWLANTSDGPKPKPAAEEVAVVRKQFDPVPKLLEPGEHELLQTLLAGGSLGHAFENALAVVPEFKLDGTLGWLVSFDAIAGVGLSPKDRD